MKMKTTLALFAAMAAVMAVPLSADAKEFTDVASDHWYYDYVSEISDKGIMTGKDAAGTVFAPAGEYSACAVCDGSVPYGGESGGEVQLSI